VTGRQQRRYAICWSVNDSKWYFWLVHIVPHCIRQKSGGTRYRCEGRAFLPELATKLTPRHFYKGLLEQLGCEAKFYRGDAKRQLHKEIELMRGIHHLQPVVIVDEAHLLDREMLEEVRFLLNFKMDAQSPMALILVGQSELWEKLQLQTYAAIRQRIDLQCKLPHLDRAQVGEYVQRHLAYAGADHDIFSDSAMDEIFRFSGGAARLINKVCTHCLLYGAQNSRRIIDDHIVKLVIQGELA
jgi:general secretion pathway protein A